VDVTFLLEGIDTSTPAPICTRLILCVFPGCSPIPILLLVWLPSCPLAFVHTACQQVLAVDGLLCHPLVHLSASSHHMLGYGDLDLLSGSSRFVLTFIPLWGFLPPDGVGGRWPEARCSHRRCNSRLSPVYSASYLSSVRPDSLTAACG